MRLRFNLSNVQTKLVNAYHQTFTRNMAATNKTQMVLVTVLFIVRKGQQSSITSALQINLMFRLLLKFALNHKISHYAINCFS